MESVFTNWVSKKSLAFQPVSARRKLVAVQINNPVTGKPIYFSYDNEIANSITTGIRLVNGGDDADDTGTIHDSSLVVFPGTQSEVIGKFTNPGFSSLWINLVAPTIPGKKKDVLVNNYPVLALLGTNARSIDLPAGTRPLETVTPLFNKAIDPGNSYVVFNSPNSVPAGLYLVFAWDYIPFRKTT